MSFFKKIIPAIIFAAIFMGCEKTELGCTEKHAANFSITANEDDGSCFYNDITFIFWLNEERVDFYTSSGATFPMDVAVNGEVIGTLNEDNTFDTKPDCSEGGIVKYIKEMSGKNSSIQYDFMDQYGNIYYGVTRNIDAAAGECQRLLL